MLVRGLFYGLDKIPFMRGLLEIAKAIRGLMRMTPRDFYGDDEDVE